MSEVVGVAWVGLVVVVVAGCGCVEEVVLPLRVLTCLVFGLAGVYFWV